MKRNYVNIERNYIVLPHRASRRL